ncbi:DUF1345 domain-containing protein [Larkinella soli]|uniref:DUF1345 domain-containing protein n=1 Tax=Larkinella soli TaxID=1770527 RepID=UPI000FFBB333|nr:DUF1345 domain-containing protein [Larkinella soli]
MMYWLHRLSKLDAHHRLMAASGTALLTGVLTQSQDRLTTRIILIWLVFGLTLLLLSWVTILLAHPRKVAQFYRLQDASRTALFVLVVVAALASLFAVIGMLETTQGMDRAEVDRHIYLSVCSVLTSWALVHTIFTLRYAHLWNEKAPNLPGGGLNFPNDDNPDFLDFAYFSFVIGMTSQVSDVGISSKTIRRHALFHGLISFLFNAVIVGLTINLLSGLLKP